MTLAEMLTDIPPEPRRGQDVIHPWSDPLYKQGHLTILKGNLSPEGCVAKITGLKQTSIAGPARVFDSEPECLRAILAKKIKAGDVVVFWEVVSPKFPRLRGSPIFTSDFR
jgi:dihydroxy-acid dehydratase